MQQRNKLTQNQPLKQPELPLDFAPDVVRNHGLRDAHRRPLVSNGKTKSGKFHSFRTSPAEAWNFLELQYADSGSSYVALVMDCDRPELWRPAIIGNSVPLPNWIVERLANGHAHLVYTLTNPVHRYPSASQAALDYFSHISEYYREALGADPGYNGILAHNPEPQRKQDQYETRYILKEPYTLGELAQVIPFNWKPPPTPQTGVGRNCSLFRAGMAWAGRKANASLDVYTALIVANQKLAEPLPLFEVSGIARSIEKYRNRWRAKGWHSEHFLNRQAARGARGGKKSKRGPVLYDPNDVPPWVSAGISRATWYRRKAAGEQLEIMRTNETNKPTQIG